MEMDLTKLHALLNDGLFETIMDNSSDGITYTDETGAITFTNEAYFALTGVPRDLVLGGDINTLNAMGFPVSRIALEVFETHEAKSEVICYRSDSEREVMVTVTPAFSHDGLFRGIVANFRDLTEMVALRHKMEITYLKHDEELKQKEETNRNLRSKLDKMLLLMEDYDVLGKSRQMQNLAELALRISRVNSTVLITGESGVGKDVFCRMVHKLTDGSLPYVKISCGAIPEALLESELFGYEAGAFTGASKNGKAGIFELAGDGVVFLDEIGEMPMPLQVKLLTVLQDRSYFRLGGTKELSMNARIMAATNRDLKAEIAHGNFRQDLYYRLNVIPVHIPPLRERKEDILPLAGHILKRLNEKNKTNRRLSPEIQTALTAYDWPGNIRELSNMVEQMYVLSQTDSLGLAALPLELAHFMESDQVPLPDLGTPLKDAMAEIEGAYILQHLHSDRTLRETADCLGIDVSTLVRKMNKYHLPKRYRKAAPSDS